MNPVQIFLLGWKACEEKRILLTALEPSVCHANHIVPPTEEEIEKLIQEHNDRTN